jgi:hypothetical protein
MPTRNGNALRESANPGNVAERSLHRGGSLNIANLPNDIRAQLNLRLLEGETGRELAAWLNALPEVQSILDAQFHGSPVSEVNLTHWRQGGYLQWLTERECFDTARALADGDCDLASAGLSAERLLNVLTVRFGQLLIRWDSSADESISESVAFSEISKKARILQGISRSVLAIHRIQSQSALKKSEPATSFASSHATHEQDAKSCPATGGLLAEGKAKGEFRDDGMPLSSAKGKSASEEGTPRNGTILSPASRHGCPKILSGPIMPSNLSHTPFKRDHDLEEILNAV